MSWIILGVLVVIALVFVGIYNSFVRGRNQVEEAWSGIDVQLKRRYDLIPQLVTVVKGYAAHEKEVFARVVEARSRAMGVPAGDLPQLAQAEGGLSKALRSLFAVAENYPQLKASKNFLQLQESYALIEDEIQMARRYYNGAARDQNNRIMQFPGNILAGMTGFSKKVEYFELADDAQRQAPEMKF